MRDALGPTDAREIRELVADRRGRIDAAVAAAFADLSRARVQRMLAEGDVLIGGETARKSLIVEPGDHITVHLREHDHAPGSPSVAIPVLFEDAELVVIDKPPGLATHGAPGDIGPSVAGWFLNRYPAESRVFEAARPGIVHRLDKDTSGVLVLAKIPSAHATLGSAFEQRETEKLYIAICDGVPDRPRAIIEAPIGRHPGDRTRMAIVKHGREAKTEYETLGTDGRRSMLLVRLHTGRTHQIRVHLAALNTPVAGDIVYGRRTRTEARQLLHAWRLAVPHPGGGILTATASLPADVAAAVRAMGLKQLALDYSKSVGATVSESVPAAGKTKSKIQNPKSKIE